MLFLAAGSYGIRRLEAAMAALVALMSCCWLGELLLADWRAVDVAEGLLLPRLRGPDSLFVAISLLGAVIMPHNLYLHSGLVLSRQLPPGVAAARMAMRYYNLESALALLVTLFVNCAVVIVGASAVASPAVRASAAACPLLSRSFGPWWRRRAWARQPRRRRARMTGLAQMTAEMREALLAQPLQNAPIMLRRVLGRGANGAFAVALLASGQSSTITGVVAGEFVMSGFIELRVPRALRSLLTRLVAIVPALAVTLVAGERGSERIILVCSVLLSVLLPFALIPLVKFATCDTLMGVHRLGVRAKCGVWVLVACVVGANAWLVAGNLGGGGARAARGTALALAYCALALALAVPPVRQRHAPGGCTLEETLLPAGGGDEGVDQELRLGDRGDSGGAVGAADVAAGGGGGV